MPGKMTTPGSWRIGRDVVDVVAVDDAGDIVHGCLKTTASFDTNNEFDIPGR
jgi:hypothetical protein